MIRSLSMMLTCHWSASRIDRYLDGDPSVPLGEDEVQRLERHLRECARCAATVTEARAIHSSLRRLAERSRPDEGSVARVRDLVARLADDPHPH